MLAGIVCAGCGCEITRHRRGAGRGWCSAACRRRFVRRLRQLALDVARSHGAVEMPAEVAARDDMIRRYVSTVAPRQPTRQPRFQFADAVELPEYGA